MAGLGISGDIWAPFGIFAGPGILFGQLCEKSLGATKLGVLGFGAGLGVFGVSWEGFASVWGQALAAGATWARLGIYIWDALGQGLDLIGLMTLGS